MFISITCHIKRAYFVAFASQLVMKSKNQNKCLYLSRRKPCKYIVYFINIFIFYASILRLRISERKPYGFVLLTLWWQRSSNLSLSQICFVPCDDQIISWFTRKRLWDISEIMYESVTFKLNKSLKSIRIRACSHGKQEGATSGNILICSI